MQLPHRAPLTDEERELIKARTRQTKLMTWLGSLSFGALFVLIALPACSICLGCLLALVMTGTVAVNPPTP